MSRRGTEEIQALPGDQRLAVIESVAIGVGRVDQVSSSEATVRLPVPASFPGPENDATSALEISA